jgi:hypothetical protein
MGDMDAGTLKGLLIGLIIAVFGFLYNELRKIQDRIDTLHDATRDILAEMQGNKKLVAGPFRGVIAFPVEKWNARKGEIHELPGDIKDALHDCYNEIIVANAIAGRALRLPHGRGYEDNNYKRSCEIITQKCSNAIGKLEKWHRDATISEGQAGGYRAHRKKLKRRLKQ